MENFTFCGDGWFGTKCHATTYVPTTKGIGDFNCVNSSKHWKVSHNFI